MGALKSCLAAVIAAISLPGPAVSGADTLLYTFASCAGRLSAEMEHAWLMSEGDADRAEAQRSAMVSLVEAITPPDKGRDVLIWRVDAKVAQARLLNRATFNRDDADARWAARRAETEITYCVSLLLS